VKLTIVVDTHAEQLAIYIDGMHRGQWDESDFSTSDLIECYEWYARDVAVVLERIEVNSQHLRIWSDDAGEVEWPEQLGALFSEIVQ